MSKTAFIYPGQGAQKAGMGADFYENSEIARYIFDQAGEELGLDMKALCFEENDKLDLTEYTQAAMVTTCLAMTRVAENKGLKADVTAGLSLGEYPAIAIAGGMNDMDAIRLVRKRGILMQNTVPAGEGAMCAVISKHAENIEEVFDKDEVDRIYLNFSDPWPKDRHAKRRLTSTRFLERYDNILTPEGRVMFKTDNKDLFDFSLEQVEEAGWILENHTYDLHHSEYNEGNVMTEYEEKFSAKGNPICRLVAYRHAK